MAKRNAISKKQRFEILKRDSFTCQYCGEKAPEVILHVDHIKPVFKDGDNNFLNLITSCKDCNFGKGKRELSDKSVLTKQLNQLEELNEKQQQLEMMVKWRKELLKLTNKEMDVLRDHWKSLTGYGFNKNGERSMNPLIKKYGVQSIIESMDIANDKYIRYDGSGDATDKSWEYAFGKIRGITYVRSLPEEKQKRYKKIGYLRTAIVGHFDYYDKLQMYNITKELLESTCDIDNVSSGMGIYTNWDNWVRNVKETIEYDKPEGF